MKSIYQLMDLNGKVAIITGGGGHIGKAMAESLSEAGATTLLMDLTEQSVKKAAAEINSKNTKGKAIPIVCDISNESETRKTVQSIIKEYGRLDTLMHSAALVGTSKLEGWSVPLLDQSIQTWDMCLRINLTSAFYLAQESAAALKKTNGNITFIISTYGLVGPDWSLYEGTTMGNPSAYGASKGGLLQLMRYLSTNLAPHVRVNSITPGGVERGQPAVFQERYVNKTPLKRMSAEEDYKGAALYLSSDLSKYVTGHNLVVDGGWTAW